ncbi:MAG: type II secretion system protein [Planctomycetota bacterium]
MRTRTGFTLVELLVVIAIIMLLVALILPVMRSARGAAYQAVGASNMRQLYLGFQSYAGDNRGALPFVDAGFWGQDLPMRAGDVDWIGYWVDVKKMPKGGTLWPYILNRKIYICPADVLTTRKDFHIWTPIPGVHSYTVPVNREGRPFTADLGGKVLLVDESETTINDGGFATNWDSIASRHRTSGYGAETRTNAGGNIMFGDGRVEFYHAGGIVAADAPMFQ